MEQTEKISDAHLQPRLSRDWPVFADRLASVLAGLTEDHYLVLSDKRSNRFIQFAGQGRYGLRAETTSNAYLSERESLSEEEIRLLQDAGWLPPTGTPAASTPEADPDGSPNFHIDFPDPVAHAEVARLAGATLSGILRIPHPGFLEYEAFDASGNSLLLPKLGLKRAERGAAPDLARRLLAVLREVTGIVDLDFDEEGDIAVRFGSALIFIFQPGDASHVRLYSPLALNVRESRRLLARLNEFNAGTGHMHFFHRDESVHAMAEIPATPFVADHFALALRQFSKTADGIHDLLEAEFGGNIPHSEVMPNRLRH